MTLLLLMGALPGALDVAEGVLSRMDANGDGQLSEAEYSRFDERGSFSSVDQDKNGEITAVELQTWIRLTDPARNPRPHPGTSTPPAPFSPPSPVKKSQVPFPLIGIGVLVTLLGLGIWRWRSR